MKKVGMPGSLTWRPSSTSVLPGGWRNICSLPTKKGAPRPLLVPRDGLRAPSNKGVAPAIAFCYPYTDHKGSPCGSGAGDGGPAKARSSARFFGLCGVNAGDLAALQSVYGQKRPSTGHSLLRACVIILRGMSASYLVLQTLSIIFLQIPTELVNTSRRNMLAQVSRCKEVI